MEHFYFKHHGEATSDFRLRLVKEKYGYAGIGVYWAIVECVEMWGGGNYPRNGVIIMVRERGVTEQMINSLLDDFGLFEFNEYNHVMLSNVPAGICDTLEYANMLKKWSLRRCKALQIRA